MQWLRARGGCTGGWWWLVGPSSVSARCSCFRVEGMALPGAVTYPWRWNNPENPDIYTHKYLNMKVYAYNRQISRLLLSVFEINFVDFLLNGFAMKLDRTETTLLYQSKRRMDLFLEEFTNWPKLTETSIRIGMVSSNVPPPKVSSIDRDSQGHLSFPTMDIAWNDLLR